MDQRSSTQVDQLLRSSRQALAAGKYDMALQLASKAKSLSPYNADVKQAIMDAMVHRNSSGDRGTVHPVMEIPRGQEPPDRPVRAVAEDLAPRRGISRPGDASGGWELGLRQQTTNSADSRATPSRDWEGGTARSSSMGGTSVPPLRPFVPGPDRRPSNSVGSENLLSARNRQAVSDSATVPPILSHAGRAAADGVLLGIMALRALIGQVGHQARKMTARGLLLMGGYLAMASFLIYAGMTANQTFGVPPFPPLAQKAIAGLQTINPSRNLARAIAADADNSPDEPRPGPAVRENSSRSDSIQTGKVTGVPTTGREVSPQEPVIAGLPSLDARGNPSIGPSSSLQSAGLSAKDLATQAENLFGNGKPAEGIALIEANMSAIPSVARPALQKLMAQGHHLQGENLVRQAKFGDAIVAYEKAVDHDQSDADYRLALGNALYYDAVNLKDKQGQSLPRFRQAATVVEQAVKMAPTNYQAHHRLAIIYEALKRSQDARKSWQAVLKHSPASSKSAVAADKALKRLPRRG